MYVREDRLLDCVQTFFAQRVLGPDRAVLLRHQMAKQGIHEQQDHQKRIAAIEKAIAELGRRQDNIMDEREAKTIDDNDEAGRAWAERLRARFADLKNQRRTKLAELDELRIVAEREQPQQPELLDMLPQLPLDLIDAPDPLQRGLYQACGMKIYYDHTTRNVTIRATLRGETVPTVEQAANIIALSSANNDSAVQLPPQPASRDDVAHVLRALPGAPSLTCSDTLQVFFFGPGLARVVSSTRPVGAPIKSPLAQRSATSQRLLARPRSRGHEPSYQASRYVSETIPDGPDALLEVQDVRQRLCRYLPQQPRPGQRQRCRADQPADPAADLERADSDTSNSLPLTSGR